MHWNGALTTYKNCICGFVSYLDGITMNGVPSIRSSFEKHTPSIRQKPQLYHIKYRNNSVYCILYSSSKLLEIEGKKCFCHTIIYSVAAIEASSSLIQIALLTAIPVIFIATQSFFHIEQVTSIDEYRNGVAYETNEFGRFFCSCLLVS